MLNKMTQYDPKELDAKDIISLYEATLFVKVKKGAFNDMEVEDRPPESFIAEVVAIDGEDDPQFIVASLNFGLYPDILVPLDEIEFLSIVVLPKRK